MSGDDYEVIVELAFVDLAAIRLPPAAKGRRMIVLESRQGEWIEIDGASERRVIPDLLGRAISHLLAASPIHRLILVWIQLRPNGLQAAVKRLRGDPRFSMVSSAVSDVFVVDDELVFLFATGRTAARTKPLWDLIAGWDENVVKIGIAEQAYSSLDERTHAR
jgi:hypothetical protein